MSSSVVVRFLVYLAKKLAVKAEKVLKFRWAKEHFLVFFLHAAYMLSVAFFQLNGNLGGERIANGGNGQFHDLIAGYAKINQLQIG